MDAPRTTGGFGGRLREARERKGVTLRQIAGATKISVGALEALERNDLSRLPGGIFTRAFVRSYAVEVGLDPDKAIEEFSSQFPNHLAIARHTAAVQVEDDQGFESERRIASTVLRLTLFSLPLAGLLLYALTSRRDAPQPSPPPQPAATAGSASPAAEGSLPRTGDAPVNRPAPVREPEPPATSSARLAVGLSFSGPCWVTAIVDGTRTIAREMRQGDQRVLEAQTSVVLTIGEAGALNLTINGMPAKPLGKPGQVATVRISADDFQRYLMPR